MKPFYKSKTFWVSALEILGGFALFLAGEVEGGAVLTGAGVVQLFLRYVTKEPISLK
jgi:hypothetical protein